MFLLRIAALFLALGLGFSAFLGTSEDIGPWLESLDKNQLTPEMYKLAVCLLGTNLKMKIDRDILSKFYSEKNEEGRSLKVMLQTVKTCMDKMTTIAKIPVS